MSSGLPEGAVGWLHDVGRMIGRYGFHPAFRIRVHGAERVPGSGPLVVVANHSSMLEPQLIFGMLPRRSVFLVKQELFRGFGGWFLRRIGQIRVRGGEPDRTPLLTAIAVLKDGGAVGIFPEGSRGSGDVGSAEQGAAWLVRAVQAQGVTLLPVATRGTRKPDNGRRRFRPRVDILFGEPFDLEVGRGRSGLVTATEQLRGELAAVVRALDDWREVHGFAGHQEKFVAHQEKESG